jgi:hypothetical protein
MPEEREERVPATPNDVAVYQPYVGTTFTIHGSPAPVVLQLARIDDRGVRDGTRHFSLFFHGAPAQLLHEGTYVLEHDALGPLLLFIAPVQGSTRERILYEACFTVVVDTPSSR